MCCGKPHKPLLFCDAGPVKVPTPVENAILPAVVTRRNGVVVQDPTFQGVVLVFPDAGGLTKRVFCPPLWEAVPSCSQLAPSEIQRWKFPTSASGSKALQEQFFPPRHGANQKMSCTTLAAAYRKSATRQGTTGTHKSHVRLCSPVVLGCLSATISTRNSTFNWEKSLTVHAMMSSKCVAF